MSDGLEVLVAQHFERLDKIIADTIRQLEELKACIPVTVFYTGIGATVTKHVNHIKGAPCTADCGPMELPNPVDYMRNRGA